jgi:hypothetical protein
MIAGPASVSRCATRRAPEGMAATARWDATVRDLTGHQASEPNCRLGIRATIGPGRFICVTILSTAAVAPQSMHNADHAGSMPPWVGCHIQ